MNFGDLMEQSQGPLLCAISALLSFWSQQVAQLILLQMMVPPDGSSGGLRPREKCSWYRISIREIATALTKGATFPRREPKSWCFPRLQRRVFGQFIICPCSLHK